MDPRENKNAFLVLGEPYDLRERGAESAGIAQRTSALDVARRRANELHRTPSVRETP